MITKLDTSATGGGSDKGLGMGVILLLVAAAAGAAYYFWNKNKKEEEAK